MTDSTNSGLRAQDAGRALADTIKSAKDFHDHWRREEISSGAARSLLRLEEELAAARREQEKLRSEYALAASKLRTKLAEALDEARRDVEGGDARTANVGLAAPARPTPPPPAPPRRAPGPPATARPASRPVPLIASLGRPVPPGVAKPPPPAARPAQALARLKAAPRREAAQEPERGPQPPRAPVSYTGEFGYYGNPEYMKYNPADDEIPF